MTGARLEALLPQLVWANVAIDLVYFGHDTSDRSRGKDHLSRLLKEAVAGEDVVITRSGTPIARLVPIKPATPRELGRDRGRFEVPDDFDDLPAELIRDFDA